MPNTFYLKKGDTMPRIETILSDADGPVDLTGCTVKFRMSIAGAGNPLLNGDAVVVTPQTGDDKGRVYYEWQAGETDTTGEHQAEWRVTYDGGGKATFPRGSGELFNKVVIQEEVA